VLHADEEARGAVERHAAVVVQRPHGVEVLGRHGQDGHVLDVVAQVEIESKT